MVSFPNCKINLGLNITRKRADGYHDIETVFYPLSFTDALEVITADQNATAPVFSASGFAIDGNIENNLCVRAYHLLKKDFTRLPGIRMHLHKAIPMGAGLGGGSADAAFTLLLLNEKFNLGLGRQQLLDYALKLGSDCPFFIINKPCFAGSRGEVLEEIVLDLSDYKMVIINPGIHINTKWAFTQIAPATPAVSIKSIVHLPVEQWKETLLNDFERPVIKHYPILQAVKAALYNYGALYAAMSGSGSSFYGLFPKNTPINIHQFSPGWLVKVIKPG